MLIYRLLIREKSTHRDISLFLSWWLDLSNWSFGSTGGGWTSVSRSRSDGEGGDLLESFVDGLVDWLSLEGAADQLNSLLIGVGNSDRGQERGNIRGSYSEVSKYK